MTEHGSAGAQPWHAMDCAAACQQLEVSPQRGLFAEQIVERLQQHGPNRLASSALLLEEARKLLWRLLQRVRT